MINSEEITNLLAKFEHNMSYVPVGNHKFYHINTVRNFINSVSEFSDSTTQEFVFRRLEEYVEFVKDNIVVSDKDSLSVFNQFLNPLGEHYRLQAGFRIYVKPGIIIVFLLPLLVITYFIGLSIWIYVLILIAFLMWYVPLLNKAKSGKAYAYLW